MGKNIKIKSSLYIGAIVVICTFMIFFIGFSSSSNQLIDYLGLVFIIFSEILLFSGLFYILSYKTSMNKLIIVSGMMSTLIIYWITTIIMAIISKSIFKDNINTFIVVQIIIIAVVSIIIIALMVFASNVENSNKKVIDSKSLMDLNENIIFLLKTDDNFSSYYDGFNKIYEELKYSDKVSYTIDKDIELNEKIENLYDELKNTDDFLIDSKNINGQIEKILYLIKERNKLLSQTKRGDF